MSTLNNFRTCKYLICYLYREKVPPKIYASKPLSVFKRAQDFRRTGDDEKASFGSVATETMKTCMDRKSKAFKCFIINDKFSLSHHLNNFGMQMPKGKCLNQANTDCLTSVFYFFCIFHHFCLFYQIIVFVLQVLPTSKQCVTFTAECQICVGCIGNTFSGVYRVHDTEVVKLPYLPEYVSSKCSKEESKSVISFKYMGTILLYCYSWENQKNNIRQLLDAYSTYVCHNHSKWAFPHRNMRKS